jgi:hypothetical protein
MDRAVSPAVYVEIDLAQLVRVEPQFAPRRHTSAGHSIASDLQERRLGWYRASVAESLNQRRGERRAGRVLAVTSGTVELELFSALVRRGRESVLGRWVILREPGVSAAADSPLDPEA